MTWVYSTYGHAFQFLDTGFRCSYVIGNGVENRLIYVHPQIAAEQVFSGRQNPNGSFGMPWDRDDFGLKSVNGKIVTILNIEIWRESFRFAKPGEERDYLSDENVGFLSERKHVALFDHARIVMVHRDLTAERVPEVCRISSMIEISMGQKDELEETGFAAGSLKFP